MPEPLAPVMRMSPDVAVRVAVVLTAFEVPETPLITMPLAPVMALLMLMPSAETAAAMFAVVM